MKKLYTLLLISFLFLSSSAQTLINRTSVDTLGHAINYYNLFTGANAETGHVILAGNGYLTSAYESFFIAKYSLDTGLVWLNDLTQQPAGKRQFGTDVYFKKDYVYGAAFTWDSASGKAAINAIKMDNATGDTVWTTSYTGSYNGYNVPSSIVVDSSGNVFIAGTEQTGALDFKMIVIKYNSSGAQQWVSSYDSVGLYDGAVAAELTNTRVNITGFSGNGFGSWDFVQGSYLKSNGNTQQVRRHVNGQGNFSRPVGLGKDLWSNLYVGGTAAFNNGKTGIKIISYDTSFAQLWFKRMGDTSQNCEAVAMETDIWGNTTIVGTQNKSNGGKDIITAKYDTAGTQLWLRTVSAPDPTKEAKAGDIAMQDLSGGNLYITGSMSNGTNTDVVTFSYDTDGNLRWLKTFTREGNYNDAGTLVLNDENYVQVALTSYGSDSLLMGVTYEEWTLPTETVNDTNSKPVYLANQLIVRFNPSLVNSDFVNNTETHFGYLDDILVDSIIDSLSVKTGIDLNDRNVRVSKIFKRLTTADSLNITLYGDTVEMPKFWSSFLLNFEFSTDSILLAFQDSLNQSQKFVFNAGKNMVIESFSYPNDPEYPNTNGHFANSFNGLCDATQGINICPLWNQGVVGDPSVRIGIYDNGIRHTHEEFSIVSANSKAYEGIDFATGQQNPNTDVDNHGTGIAAIAAGLSNNSLGIAGVAGGDINGFGSNPGCTIVNLKFNHTIADACEALVQGSYNTPTMVGGGYNIHIANLSWGFSTTGIFDIRAMQDAIRWLYRNGVVCVAASGDNPTVSSNYPATLPDNFVIKVIGSKTNGLVNTNFAIGPLADLNAPSEGSQFVLASNASDNAYTNLVSGVGSEGTSYSAAFVSGTAALLSGYYYNETWDGTDGTRLLPDDIENLLEIYAKNNSIGYSHGLLDAGNTYNHLTYPIYKVRQRRAEPGDASAVTLVNSSLTIDLYDNYEKASGSYNSPNILLPRGAYVVDVYKVGGSVSFGLPANETVINYWKDNSKTTLWNKPQGTLNRVFPENDFIINSLNTAGASLEGYAYYFISGPGGAAINQWFPVDVSGNNFGNGQVYFSLHTYDATFDDVSEVLPDGFYLNTFPNPTNNALTITTNLPNSTAALFNASGQLIHSVEIADGSKETSINTNSFAAGVYALVVSNHNNVIHRKVIVCH